MNKKWLMQRRMELLSSMTDAEKAIARTLKAMGYSVIQQYPIETGRKIFFADLCIPAIRLILEIDGGYHDTSKQKRLDSNRSSCIRRKGWHVCRLSNRDARTPQKIQAKINLAIKKNRAGK